MNNINILPVEDRPFQLDDHGPIFILGCPRSGTTFLSNVIGTISGLEEYIGVLAPPRIMHLLNQMPESENKTLLMHSIRDIFWQTFWRDKISRFQRFKKFLSGSGELKDALKINWNFDGSLFCYKEPFMCFAAKEFAQYFPNAKFIHIIRDGRDNADSLDRRYKDALSDQVLMSDNLTLNKISEIGSWTKINGVNVPYWVPEVDKELFVTMSKFERCVLMWREMVIKGREIKNIVPENRYIEIRYEDFVANPIEYGNKIFGFLNKEVSKQNLKKLNKAYSSSIGISKSNIEEDKINKANLISGDLLFELGYKI